MPMRVTRERKARWVKQSRAEGKKLTDWIIERVERADPLQEPIVTSGDLRAWQQRLGLTYDTASEALDMHRATYARYLKHEGELPRWLGLACERIASATASQNTFKPRLNRPPVPPSEK